MRHKLIGWDPNCYRAIYVGDDCDQCGHVAREVWEEFTSLRALLITLGTPPEEGDVGLRAMVEERAKQEKADKRVSELARRAVATYHAKLL